MTRSVSLCCTPIRSSMSLGRTPQPLRIDGSQCVVMNVWPRGALSAPHSPFAALFGRGQAGAAFPLASFHVRNALRTRVLIGLLAVAVAVDSLATYRPKLARRTLRP